MDNLTEKYRYYEISDFLTDEYFQDWVHFPNEQSEIFWNSLISSFPEKKQVIEEARLFLSKLDFVRHIPAEGAAEHSFLLHLSQIRQLELKWKRSSYVQFLRIAAVISFTLISFFSLWYIHQYVGEKTFHTDYGETRKIVLPDSSEVMLQSNSVLTYKKDWSGNVLREVKLSGEAFFNIRHINQNSEHILLGEKFLVHAQLLDIEVLGTVFNVKERRNTAAVFLKSGKVKIINYHGKSEIVILKPGEMYNYDPDLTGKPKVYAINSERPIAWTRGILMFDGMKIQDLLFYLADNYGYQIHVTDMAILNHEISGSINLDSGYDLIFLLENVLHLKIQQNGKNLNISSRK